MIFKLDHDDKIRVGAPKRDINIKVTARADSDGNLDHERTVRYHCDINAAAASSKNVCGPQRAASRQGVYLSSSGDNLAATAPRAF